MGLSCCFLWVFGDTSVADKWPTPLAFTIYLRNRNFAKMTVKINSNNESAVETHGRASLTSNVPSTADLQIRIRELEKEIARLHGQIKEQRYGLTWLDVPEAFETESENKIPILEEVKEKAIDAAGRDALNASANNTPPHIIIEGDNYHALSCLNYTHRGKIDVIYIDPPYNTGNDGFTYKDKRFLKEFPDGSPVPKEHPLRHSYWLSFMSKRLELAKNLLSDKGVIFISIDDNEQANLKLLCDKVFGEENMVCNLIWKSKSGGANDASSIASDHEYVLCYAKKTSSLVIYNDIEATVSTQYNKEDENGKYALDRLDKQSLGYQASLDFPIIGPDGKEYKVEHKDPKNKKARWRWGKDTVKERYDELVFIYPYVYTKNYEKKDGQKPRTILFDERFGRTRTGSTDLKNVIGNQSLFAYPKPISLLKYLFTITTNSNLHSTILDFFAGSGTTLHATMKLNAEDGGHRQCILVQQREGDNNICENVTYERNRRVMCGYTNAKGEQVEGLGGRLKYYRTAFVGKHASHNAIDADRVELSRKAGYLLALGENTLEEIAHTDTYQIFADTRRDDVNIVSDSNSLASCYTAIYFTENYAKMPEFVAEIDKLRSVGTCNPQINVYIFCWGTPEIFEGEFDDLRGIALKAIPQPILDVYKSINQ